jgi:hypothetical protein
VRGRKLCDDGAHDWIGQRIICSRYLIRDCGHILPCALTPLKACIVIRQKHRAPQSWHVSHPNPSIAAKCPFIVHNHTRPFRHASHHCEHAHFTISRSLHIKASGSAMWTYSTRQLGCKTAALGVMLFVPRKGMRSRRGCSHACVQIQEVRLETGTLRLRPDAPCNEIDEDHSRAVDAGSACSLSI